MNIYRWVVTLIILPYALGAQDTHSQESGNDIQALIQNAEQKVAVEASRADEVKASLDEANQLATALEEVAGPIMQDPMEDVTIEELLDQHAANILQSQAEIVLILYKQYEQLFQTEQTGMLLAAGYLQRIQAQYEQIKSEAATQPDDTALQDALAVITVQVNKIGDLSQQLLTHKNSIEQVIRDTQRLTRQAVNRAIEVITKIKRTVSQFARQQGISKQERQARTRTAQIITSLLEIEQHIETLLELGLYKDALRGARVAQTVQRDLWPITLDIAAMQTKVQQVQTLAEDVKNLIPVEPDEDELPPVDQRATAEPDQAPAAPITRAPQVIPSGKARENISKINSRLESALRRLDVVKGYFNQIDASERAVVKQKAANLLKEYESGMRKFANRIRQVKAEGGLDQQKLEPFNKFLDLTDKISSRVKSL